MNPILGLMLLAVVFGSSAKLSPYSGKFVSDTCRSSSYPHRVKGIADDRDPDRHRRHSRCAERPQQEYEHFNSYPSKRG